MHTAMFVYLTQINHHLTQNGQTPLMTACVNGNLSMFTCLLNHGAQHIKVIILSQLITTIAEFV